MPERGPVPFAIHAAAVLVVMTAALNTIVDKHPSVRALVGNGWLRLHALGEAGAITHRYAGNLAWQALEPSEWKPFRESACRCNRCSPRLPKWYAHRSR